MERKVQVPVCLEQNLKKPIGVCQNEEERKHITVKFLLDRVQELRRDVEMIQQANRNHFGSLTTTIIRRPFKMNDKTKRYNPGDSTIPLVDEEDQFDFLCEGFDSPRARMSCGHVVTPTSLTKWCQQLLEQGKSRFECGQFGCHAEWSYEEVCKMAMLTPEEMKTFETTLALNAAARNSKAKFCPGCMTPVTRGSSLNLYVCCPGCSAKTGRSFGFCWQCLREWKGPQPRSERCENDDCHNSALKTLRECPEVQINTVKGLKGCPSVRACPTCGSLLQHTGKGCKNITCPRCKTLFCFGCLKTTNECRSTGNNNVYGVCSTDIVPRQTSIPVWQRK